MDVHASSAYLCEGVLFFYQPLNDSEVVLSSYHHQLALQPRPQQTLPVCVCVCVCVCEGGRRWSSSTFRWLYEVKGGREGGREGEGGDS